MFGPCKSCIAHRAHINSLNAEILFLRTMVQPINDPMNLPLIMREADAVLSNKGEILDYEPAQKIEAQEMSEEDIVAERDRILSGQY